VKIPDYVSLFVGWRVWQWDAAGLKSLNGEPWLPGRPIAAGCRVAGAYRDGRPPHGAPQMRCTCGVYGSKSLDHLRGTQYWQFGSVHGEVVIWGSVVEHEQGFRAQFAYPKTLYLPSEILPVTLREIQTRIQALTKYGCDLFIRHETSSLPLWRNESGLEAAGLEFLMSRGQDWYARRKQERAINNGDRIAVLGRGIALVEQVTDEHVRAVLWNRATLRMSLTEITWDERNMRWEATPTPKAENIPSVAW
jgi:hypothetical protein